MNEDVEKKQEKIYIFISLKNRVLQFKKIDFEKENSKNKTIEGFDRYGF